MAILHPQECYLLERFTSPEHYAETRDAVIAFINAHEAALSRYKHDIPLNSRKMPLWQQADLVWENRVMPNMRDLPGHFTTRTIQRINNDPEAYSIGNAMGSIRKGIVEFWDGWMTEDEGIYIANCEYIASQLDRKLSCTISGVWMEGDLTYNSKELVSYFKMPNKIPLYELDSSVRIEINEKPSVTGIYLPDNDHASARFIYATYPYSPDARTGVAFENYVDEDKVCHRYWTETNQVETGWTLIRRVEGVYIDVPPEGFFPEGKPEELYSWPQREKTLQQSKMVRIAQWSAEISTH
ncbi:hypothetical protein, partial [Pantoea sp. GM01]|uniref:hypothetical protein n=1 Tax=Pantoea sp. GM01 TaxID=1144320 RepID=UPI0002714ACD